MVTKSLCHIQYKDLRTQCWHCLNFIDQYCPIAQWQCIPVTSLLMKCLLNEEKFLEQNILVIVHCTRKQSWKELKKSYHLHDFSKTSVFMKNGTMNLLHCTVLLFGYSVLLLLSNQCSFTSQKLISYTCIWDRILCWGFSWGLFVLHFTSYLVWLNSKFALSV